MGDATPKRDGGMRLTEVALLALAAAGLFTSCGKPPTPQGEFAKLQAYSAPGDLGQAPPEDGQWAMAAKDYASTRYSGLSEINTGNAKNLKLAWTFSTGMTHGHEAAPLVIGGTMYIVTPYPNYLYALDLTHSGALKWTYKPETDPSSQGEACCDVVNRGGAYYKGKIYYNTLDNQTVAVDAETGKEVWRTKLGDINKGETLTMAPVVVKDKVLVGNSGGEFGIRGWVTAVDANSGKIAWRAYSTGPDSDVLIGSEFKPFYADHQGKDLGLKTWTGDSWKIGGGGMWGWISYDPQQDLIYYGTANPGPWNPEMRPGDNKWTSTLFARRPDDGHAVWAYQMNPHDLHDYDGINENVLTDITINGQKRKVLLHPDRNGHMYVMDRTNGEVLSAEPFGFVNTTSGVDLKTGRPAVNQEKAPGFGKTVRDVCPAAPGAKDWQPSAYSFHTGLLYIPHNNLCMEEQGTNANYIAGTPYVGMIVRMYAGPGGHRGEYTAFNPSTGKAAWTIKENFPVWSGTTVTAGDVAFYGTMDRWFKAVNAQTGDLLWQYRVGSGIIGQPVTYRGPDGKQYVAILSGVGGWSGAIVSGGLDPREGTGALGFVNAMSDLPNYTNAGGTLYVFSL
jgi:lanthanide-dependent methanol dehydrogenase